MPVFSVGFAHALRRHRSCPVPATSVPTAAHARHTRCPLSCRPLAMPLPSGWTTRSILGRNRYPFGRSRVNPRPAQFRSRGEALSFQVRYMLSLY